MNSININLSNGIKFSMHRCYRLHLSRTSRGIPLNQLEEMRNARYVELILDKSISTCEITSSHLKHLHIFPTSDNHDFYGFADVALSSFFDVPKKVSITSAGSTSIIKCSTIAISPELAITEIEVGYVMRFSKSKKSNAFSFNLPINLFNSDFISFWDSDSIKLDIEPLQEDNILLGGEINASIPNPLERDWNGDACYMNSLKPANCGKCQNSYCTIWNT